MDWRFRCASCEYSGEATDIVWRCPKCGGELLIDGLPTRLEVAGSCSFGMWRFSSVLPVTTPGNAMILGEGDSPLVPMDIDGVTIHLKLDSQLPTGSFKDRGAAVLCEYLKQIGVQRIIVDSSGNAAASMAAYAAATGLQCTVYVPATASPGKLVQARASGATVVPVEGSRDDVASAAQEAADRDPTASYASHNWHPVFVEGVKTWALEVFEQLGNRNPDYVFSPTGGGSSYVGAWRGFSITGDTLPALIAAQPAACAPIVRAAVEGTPIQRMDASATLAEGTKIALPSRSFQIEQVLTQRGAGGIAVDEELLIDTLKLLWSRGIFAEPTGALGVAASRIAIQRGDLGSDHVIVAHITGHGLKATPTIQDVLDQS
jgi:threonine synthase